jgi:hypothetical protein
VHAGCCTRCCTKAFLKDTSGSHLNLKWAQNQGLGAEGGIVRDPRQAATCGVGEFGKSEIGDTP